MKKGGPSRVAGKISASRRTPSWPRTEREPREQSGHFLHGNHSSNPKSRTDLGQDCKSSGQCWTGDDLRSCVRFRPIWSSTDCFWWEFGFKGDEARDQNQKREATTEEIGIAEVQKHLPQTLRCFFSPQSQIESKFRRLQIWQVHSVFMYNRRGFDGKSDKWCLHEGRVTPPLTHLQAPFTHKLTEVVVSFAKSLFSLMIATSINIAKGTTDPGFDYFNQLLWFGEISLVGSVWYVWFGRFGSIGSCYKLLPAVAAVKSSRQHWQLLHAVTSFDSCYKLSPAVTAVASFDSCYKLLPALTTVTSCRQLWQLLQALTAVMSCCQHWQLLQAVASFDSSYKLSTALTALASFDSSYKLSLA